MRVAYAYDRLRAHPPEVAGQIATAMASAVHPKGEEPVFLELGVGTAHRPGVPVHRPGRRCAMLEVFRQKIAGWTARSRSSRRTPGPSPSGRERPRVIVVHLWHLVPDWPRSWPRPSGS
nr:hypothetical protein [Thermus parvatiensis]